jgi:hypothetical protein
VDLWLSRNKFSGDISTFADLKNIETIHIDENEFEGTIPDMFDQIFHLREFLAQNNQFSGPIPRTITHMQSMSKCLCFLVVATSENIRSLTRTTYVLYCRNTESRKQFSEWGHS